MKGRDINRNVIKTAKKVLCTFHNARTRLNETKGKEAKKLGYAKTIRCGTPCHRKLLRSSTSALEGFHMCGDTARWHLTHHSSQPLQKRSNYSLAPYCGTLAGGIQQRLCLMGVRWTIHPNLLWHFPQNDISKSFQQLLCYTST